MAQQTINVGTSPNDGTGTPLRTAFQYTNSNFSELYTAVGPSGNNIVVPGSATITGDLTVDTSTLKVDSANNTVGIGNATPPTGASNTDIGLTLGAAGTVRSVLLGMQNCFGRIRERDAVNNLAITTNIGATGTLDDNTRSSWKIRIGSGNDNYVLQRAPIGSSTFSDLLAIDSGGVCVWSDGAGGTRMTLNATGLGLGVTPSAKLHVEGTGPQARFSVASAADARHEYYRNGIREGLITWNANVIGLFATQAGGELVLASANTIRVRVKAGGQVRFVPLASDPASAEAGDVYYNSSSNKLKCYNGTTWNDLF
jgi:hypothetical protein